MSVDQIIRWVAHSPGQHAVEFKAEVFAEKAVRRTGLGGYVVKHVCTKGAAGWVCNAAVVETIQPDPVARARAQGALI